MDNGSARRGTSRGVPSRLCWRNNWIEEWQGRQVAVCQRKNSINKAIWQNGVRAEVPRS